MNEDIVNYRGFDRSLRKEDLNEKELKCYSLLMKGIKEASDEEREEVAHLMDIFIEIDEEVPTECVRCGKEFNDNFKDITLDDKRIYCNECLRKMWG